MAATPKNGTLMFRGRSGRLYSVSVYVSDVANALITLSNTGTAGTASLNYWRAPENVVLEDYAQITGTADTTALVLQQDGADINGAVLPYAIYLNSLNNRPKIAVPFPAGSLIGAKQVA